MAKTPSIQDSFKKHFGLPKPEEYKGPDKQYGSDYATDMAKFMIAHLQQGRYKNKQILKKETADKMHKIHFSHDKRLNGMALGFIGCNFNNEKIIGHMHFNCTFKKKPITEIDNTKVINGYGHWIFKIDIQQLTKQKYQPGEIRSGNRKRQKLHGETKS